MEGLIQTCYQNWPKMTTKWYCKTSLNRIHIYIKTHSFFHSFITYKWDLVIMKSRLFLIYISHFLHVGICLRKNFLIEISLAKPVSWGRFISSLQTPLNFLLLVILTRKTWARCSNWGHLQGARAAGDTAVHSLHWSHPCSQCPWSSHSNLSHPSLASAPQDTARKERKKERWWEGDVERGWGGRHKLGRETKRVRRRGQRVHVNQDQAALRRQR